MKFEVKGRRLSRMLTLMLLVVPPAAAAANRQTTSPAGIASIVSLSEDNRPEGIALDPTGAIYLGNRRVEGGLRVSRILKVGTDGAVTVFATLEVAGNPSTAGLLGLCVDPQGNVYAAVASFDEATHGVWRIRPDGTQMARLADSQGITFPNALAFDSRGNLYVTDSVGGEVWRFDRRGNGTLWAQDALLQPGTTTLPALPPIGANGIAFVPPSTLFVANTRQGSIVRIPIHPDGSPGSAENVARGLMLLSVDGIAADAHGQLHAAIPGFAVIPGSHPLVLVNPDTGEVTATPVDETFFHFPVSLAFGTGPWDHKSVFVVNSGAILPIPGPGPGVVQAAVGAPGSIGR